MSRAKKVANQDNYTKIKSAVDKVRSFNKRTVARLKREFGFSETTFRRIKKSRDFADYQKICYEESGKNRKKLVRETSDDRVISAAKNFAKELGGEIVGFEKTEISQNEIEREFSLGESESRENSVCAKKCEIRKDYHEKCRAEIERLRDGLAKVSDARDSAVKRNENLVRENRILTESKKCLNKQNVNLARDKWNFKTANEILRGKLWRSRKLNLSGLIWLILGMFAGAEILAIAILINAGMIL